MRAANQGLAGLLVEHRARELEQSFRQFAENAWPVLEPATPFIGGRHIDIVSEYLSAVTTGQIKRLIINVPPRMMKSTLTTIMWPCWSWAVDGATSRWMCSSYSGQLSTKHSVDRRTLLTSEWYQRLWPRVQLAADSNERAAFVSTNRGHMLALSVGGATTGKGGSHVVLDDPHSVEQALSDAERSSAIRYIRQTLMTRLDDPRTGRIVLIMQRLHELDASGELLNDGGWEHLCLPAIAEKRQVISLPMSGCQMIREEGDVLEPQRLSLDALNSLKRSMGSFAFAGQMQQTPAPAEGGLFKRSWWQRYTVCPPSVSLIIQSWDCSFKDKPDADAVCGQVWGFDGPVAYLLDQDKRRMGYVATKQAMRDMHRKWPRTSAVLVEDKANGSAIIDELSREISGLIAIEPEGGKLARAWACTAQVEAGQVFIPEFAPWAEDFLLECSMFPAGAHDDAVDAMTQALNWGRSHNVGIYAALTDDLLFDPASMGPGFGNAGSYLERIVSVVWGAAKPTVFVELVETAEGLFFALRELIFDGATASKPKSENQLVADLAEFIQGRNVLTGESVNRGPADCVIICADHAGNLSSEIAGLGLYRIPPIDEDVLSGIQVLKASLERKMLRISRACPRLIQDVQRAAWDAESLARGIEKPTASSDTQLCVALRQFAKTKIASWRFSEEVTPSSRPAEQLETTPWIFI